MEPEEIPPRPWTIWRALKHVAIIIAAVYVGSFAGFVIANGHSAGGGLWAYFYFNRTAEFARDSSARKLYMPAERMMRKLGIFHESSLWTKVD